MRIPLQPYWHLLARYLKPQGPLVTLLAVLLLGNISLQVINPQIIGQFIDTAQAGGAAAALFRSAALFVGVTLVQQIVSVLVTYLGEKVGWAATNMLRTDLVRHCLHLDMSFHNVRTPGEMIERIDGDVTALSGFFSLFVVQVSGNAFLLAVLLALLFREDWRVGLVLGLFALAILLALWRLRDLAVPHWEAERQASAEQFSFLEEQLAGTEDICSSGAKAYVMRCFYPLIRALMRRSLQAGLMWNVVVVVLHMLNDLLIVAALLAGAYLLRADLVTVGTMYVILAYGTMLMRPLHSITQQVQELQRAGGSIVRIQELLGVESGTPESATAGLPRVELPGGPLAVEFCHVSFAYDRVSPGDSARPSDGSETALCDISFQLQPGTVLGLLGRTGSGKTTLAELILRLYQPNEGAIRVGDGTVLADIQRLPLPDLRQRVGMVTQNVQLFHATVRDNLTFFDPTIPDERCLRVIRELGLEEWYRSLRDGLDTELESGGAGLSAGEAQLLALARVFLKDPGLVILDEASSRLDPATERLVDRAVRRLLHSARRTAIIIAHRLETVQSTDEIMILEDGRICEHGARDVLADDPGSRFYALLRTGFGEVLA